MADIAIRVRDLGKLYRIGSREPYPMLRDTIARAAGVPVRALRALLSGRPDADPGQTEDEYVWALKNVSLDIEEGQAVGIIGPNGAGKTTLLRILSRITEPTEGSAVIHGRVGSLLDVGTGFHWELTGRENIYLNGAILGMTKREIEDKFDEIVDFAGFERFIDTPVKRYSDGMRVRLGFAVAAHLEPEILLVDEVLSVGDLQFQRKSLGKMKDVASKGRTVLFVSHDMASIQNLCDKTYLLNQGKIVASGETQDVIGIYLDSVGRAASVPLWNRSDRGGSGKLRIRELAMEGVSGGQDMVQCGSRVSFRLGYEGDPPLRNLVVNLYFYNQKGEVVSSVGNVVAGRVFDDLPARGAFVCRFEKFPLLPGAYSLDVVCSVNGVNADVVRNAFSFHVIEGDFFGTGRLPEKGEGSVAIPHDWEVIA